MRTPPGISTPASLSLAMALERYWGMAFCAGEEAGGWAWL